jgi:hypothetical protein
MEIGRVGSPVSQLDNTRAGSPVSQSDNARAGGAVAQSDNVRAGDAAPQSTSVRIGGAAPQSDQAQTGAGARSNGVKPDPKTAQAEKGHAPSSKEPSEAKSFVYGTLGLEHPQVQDKPSDGFYSAGRWLSAAVTVGTIISILV